MLGGLLFLFSMPFLPHWAFIFLGGYVIIKDYKSLKRMSRNNIFSLSLLLLYIFACIINMLFHSKNQVSFGIPYVLMHLITFFIALSLNEKDAKVLVYFIIFEAFVGFFEISIGVSSILPGAESYKLGISQYWYNNRVTGLYYNSSSHAGVLFIGLVLFEKFKHQFEYKIAIKIVLLAAILSSFSRAIIVVTVLLEIMIYYSVFANSLKSILNNKLRINKQQLYLLLFITIIVTIIAVLIIANFDIILKQFTRGKGTLELSGRPLIWKLSLEFIRNNLLFGNGSFKYFAPIPSGPIHTHNSYIQLVANHGVVLALIFLIFIFSRVNKQNILFLLPIFIDSIVETNIFWGISLMDIILFAFLFNSNFNKKS
ncbi:MAG TPA: hypothetical protein DCG75_03155 [Bacteroidales bacterium]|nr:hypothetical protein [Bacteroidales bacterium]